MIIYMTKNNINGKMYIGKDTKEDEKYLGSGIHLKRAILKYGVENFTKTIIEKCDNIDILNEREIFWIDFFNATESDIFYNIAKGGDGGHTVKGYNEIELLQYKNKLSEKGKGRKQTDETKLKISEKRKGMKFTEVTKQKISNSMKNLWKNDEYRNSQTEKLTNIIKKPCSDETKLKISKSTMGKNKGNIPWNKGIKTPQEILDKMSVAMKGKFDGEKNPSFGKKWLNKDGKNFYVKKEEVNKYIENGYKLGKNKKK